MPESAYSRVLLKVSGESLKGNRDYGLDADTLQYVASEVVEAYGFGIQIGIVVGGGNIWRGADYEATGMDRSTADSAGMLATIMNALSLQDALENQGLNVRTQSAITMPSVAEPYIRRRAMRHLEKGRVVIFAGGTGNPYMSTDTAASLRALEIGADALLMAKNNVDGVYDSDPNVNPGAVKFDHLTHHKALRLRLQALDSTALSLCMDNSLPIVVFNLFIPGNLARVLAGREIGTRITDVEPGIDHVAPRAGG
ncbi:MAG: UMP kinase [Dehalococcoidia bacterium]